MDASLGKFLVQLHLTDEHADVVVFVRLPVLPHVGEPPELVLVLHDGVVASQLLRNLAVMEITPGEAEVISEAGHRLLEMILTFDQSTAGWQFNRIKFIALKIA